MFCQLQENHSYIDAFLAQLPSSRHDAMLTVSGQNPMRPQANSGETAQLVPCSPWFAAGQTAHLQACASQHFRLTSFVHV